MCSAKENMSVGLMMVVRNEIKRLKECLDWHVPYMQEVSICDQESDDGTWELLQDYAGKSKIPFKISQDKQWGFCEPSKQKAADQLTTDWILYLDADEKFPVEFLLRLPELLKMEYDGFTFPRRNIFEVQVFNDNVPIEPKWLEVEHPSKDYQLRLTRRVLSEFPPYLHNRVRVAGKTNGERIGKLIYGIEHRKTVSEQWADNDRYKIINERKNK